MEVIADLDRSHFVEWGRLKPKVFWEQQNEVVVGVGYGEIQSGCMLMRMIHQNENRGIPRKGRGECLA